MVRTLARCAKAARNRVQACLSCNPTKTLAMRAMEGCQVPIAIAGGGVVFPCLNLLQCRGCSYEMHAAFKIYDVCVCVMKITIATPLVACIERDPLMSSLILHYDQRIWSQARFGEAACMPWALECAH